MAAASLSRPTTPDGPAHVPALDGLRGLAILLVLLHHFANVYAPSAWTRNAWHRLVGSGWCGVDLFFVLSGFLITGILYDARGGAGYFRNFYMRRVLRIFPLYYGVLAALFLALPLLARQRSAELSGYWAWLWLYAQNFKVMLSGDWVPGGMNHFWSLAVEEQFYLFWPFVVFACRRQTLMRVSVALIALALVVRLGLQARGALPSAVYVFTLSRLDGFGAGAVVALLLRGGLGRAAVARGGRAVAVIAGLLLAGVWAQAGYLEWSDRLVQGVGFTLLALCFAGVLAWAVASPPGRPVQRLLGVAPLRWLAKYSYGIYVLHFPLLALFVKYVQPRYCPRALRPLLEPHFKLIFLLTAGGVSVLLAVLTYHLFEQHFLKLKRYFPQTAASPPAEPVAVRRAA